MVKKTYSALLALFLFSTAPLLTSAQELYPACTHDCIIKTRLQICGEIKEDGSNADEINRCVCSSEFLTPVSKCISEACNGQDIQIAWALVKVECGLYGYQIGDLNEYINPKSTTSEKSTPSKTNSPNVSGSNSPNGSTDDGDSKNGGLSTGAIIGIVVGAVCALAIIAGLIIFCTKHKAKQKRLLAEAGPNNNLQPPPPAAIPPPYYQPPSHQQAQQQPLIQHMQQDQGYYAAMTIKPETQQQIAEYYPVAAEKEASTTPLVPVSPHPKPIPNPPQSQQQEPQYFQELAASEGTRPVEIGSSH